MNSKKLSALISHRPGRQEGKNSTTPPESSPIYPLGNCKTSLLEFDGENDVVSAEIKLTSPVSEVTLRQEGKKSVMKCYLSNSGELEIGTGNDNQVQTTKQGFISISAGAGFMALLTDAGRIFTVGENSVGQLSHDHKLDARYLNYRLVNLKYGQSNVFVKVAAGPEALYALSQHGEVYSCGSNACGELGTGLKNNERELVRIGGVLKGNPIVHISPKRSLSRNNRLLLIVNKFGSVYFSGTIDKNVSSREPTRIRTIPSLPAAEAHAIDAGIIFISKNRQALWFCNLDDVKMQKSGASTNIKLIHKSDKQIIQVAMLNNQFLTLLASGELIHFSYKNGKLDINVVKVPHVINISSSLVSRSFHLTQVNGKNTKQAVTNSLTAQAASADFFEKVSPLGVDAEHYPEYTVKLWRSILLCPETLNASFSKDSNATKFDMKLMKAASADLIAFLEKSKPGKKTKLQRNFVKQLLSSLVATIDVYSASLTTPEPVQLRSYLLLLVSDVLPTTSPAEYEMVLLSIAKLDVPAKKVIFNWLAKLDFDIVKSVVQNILMVINRHIANKQYTRGNVSLCKILHILNSILHESDSSSMELENVDRLFNIDISTPLSADEGDKFVRQHLHDLYFSWKAVVNNDGGRARNQMVTENPFMNFLFGFPLTRPEEPRPVRKSIKKSLPVANSRDLKHYSNLGLNTQALIESYSEKETEMLETKPEYFYFVFPFLLPADLKRKFMQFEDMQNQSDVVNSSVHNMISMAHANPLELFGPRLAENLYFRVEVSRENILQDTLEALRKQLQEDSQTTQSKTFRKPLRVKFKGEQGLDAGGVKKEFFLLLSNELFSGDNDSFVEIADSNQLWFSNFLPLSERVPESEHVSYKLYKELAKEYKKAGTVGVDGYELIGLILGLAVYNDTLLDVQFPPALYEILLNSFDGKKLTLREFAKFDTSQAKNLQYIQDITDEDELRSLDLVFEVSQEHFGTVKVIELIEDGSNIAVTLENKHRYIRKLIKYYMYSDMIMHKADALMKGFNRVIPARQAALKLFNAEELERLLTGTTELDMNVLKENATYEGGYSAQHRTVKRLWKIVLAMDTKEKQLFLRFCTGSSKAPVGGLKNVSFKVQRAGPDSGNLPTAYTCFNTLLLPDYATSEKMKHLIYLAIENSQGFGLE